MKIYAKIGTMPAGYVVAPKLRRAPWVGALFEIREKRGQSLVQVRLCEAKRIGDENDPCAPILLYLEKM